MRIGKCSEILATIKLRYNPRVNRVFTFIFTFTFTLFCLLVVVIVLRLGDIVSVVCSNDLSKGIKPFMGDLTRAMT